MIVYGIENKITGDIYVGKTKHTVEQRWKRHLQDMKYTKTKSKLYNDIKKYEPDNFVLYIIEQSSASRINEREIYWIEVLEPAYNIAKGGSGGVIGTGQLGRRWKVKDTSNMRGKKTITPAVIEGRKQITGANNYQSVYNIHTPWGSYPTWTAAITAARTGRNTGIPVITNVITLQKYCESDITLPANGRRTPKEWRGKSSRELGFFLEKR